MAKRQTGLVSGTVRKTDNYGTALRAGTGRLEADGRLLPSMSLMMKAASALIARQSNYHHLHQANPQ